MEQNFTERTELSDISKSELLNNLNSLFDAENSICVSNPSDSVQIFKHDNTAFGISTCNMIEGVDFDLTYYPLQHLGYKAVVASISQIIAKNILPTHININISISNRFSVEALNQIYKGASNACKRYKVSLSGNQLNSSSVGLIISTTTFGTNKIENIYKIGANEYDIVCVSGDVGGAFMGLLVLEREKAVFKANENMQPDLQGYDYILERQLKPEPRTDIIEILRENNIVPTSMACIKDCLATNLLKICSISDKGAVIYENKLPIDAQTISTAEEFNITYSTAALNGGEDFELLFTVNINDYEKIRTIPEFVSVGYITDKSESVNLSTVNGPLIPITSLGIKNDK